MSPTFSERQGLIKPKLPQRGALNPATRVRLANAIEYGYSKWLAARQNHSVASANQGRRDFLWRFADEILHERPDVNNGILQVLQRVYVVAWHHVYDTLEFVVAFDPLLAKITLPLFNAVLKEHLAPYHFDNGMLVPAFSEVDSDSIAEAASEVNSPEAQHIFRAVELMCPPELDYRNSIKECISAVETVCRRITGDPSTTLGAGLNTLLRKDGNEFHPALLKGFGSIYGWTADSGDGIRHSMMNEPNLGIEDAKFMLVACSAFVNYLNCKADKV